MDIAYFKRFRMEIDLTGQNFRPPPAPPQYHFLPWEESLLEAFSLAKYLSFRSEMDADVFPCFTELAGCRRLMREIVRKPGFLPSATWLAVYSPGGHNRCAYCGAVQGIRDRNGIGAIQNIGVTPDHRNSGVGTSLLLRSLAGFSQMGVRCVHLEVTAENHGAIRLYRRVGFTKIRTVYKAVEAECAT